MRVHSRAESFTAAEVYLLSTLTYHHKIKVPSMRAPMNAVRYPTVYLNTKDL